MLSLHLHGFSKNYSTITSLLDFTIKIINHQLLLHKLSLMGFTTNTLKWISSYLFHRKQRVLKTILREIFQYYIKYLQGSLGPILFSIFINYLPHMLQFFIILMYTDELQIFYINLSY